MRLTSEHGESLNHIKVRVSPGAMVGGILLGFVEIMSVAFFPTLSGYKDAFAFMLLIAILLFRPTGLMGERLEEKI